MSATDKERIEDILEFEAIVTHQVLCGKISLCR